MRKSNFIYLFPMLLSIIALGGCSSSGGGDEGGGGSGISTIDELPRATSPVVDSSSSELRKVMKTAETGIVLGNIDANTFDTDSSIAACEATMRFKEAIASAAQGDLILCYVQAIMAANSNLGIDLYDGNSHAFDLTFNGGGEEEGGPNHVKLRLVRDANGNITQFEMFACGDGGGADEQSEYLSQTIGEDGTFEMVSKGFFGAGDGHDVSVTGQLNSSGQFISKTIELGYTYESEEGGNGHGEATVTQEPSSITLDGYEAGTFIDEEDNEWNYENRAYVNAELIDPNEGDDYNIQLLAVGDGAAHALLSGSGEMEEGWSDTVVEGWNGDTTQADEEAAAEFIDLVSDQTPVEAEDSVSIAFTDSQTYDCGDESEAPITVNEAELNTVCTNYNLGHEWVDCWQVTGEGGE